MFKYLKYSFLVLVIFVSFGIAKSNAFAYTTSFNSLSNDLDTVKVSNYTLNPGCTTCWSTSVNASPGDVVSVQIYYRNVGGINALGNVTATDSKVKINSVPGGSVGSWNVSGGAWSSNAALAGGSASVYINGTPQTITYIPGSTKWYAEHNFVSPVGLLYGQNGSEILNGAGLSLGNLLSPATCSGYPGIQFCHQGTVVARFQISNAQPQTYQCSDNLDNDNDGLVDYPQDPGCTGPTDNSEYNQVFQCSDNLDNDNDGLVDYPQDPGCISATDNDEYNIASQSLQVTTSPATSITQTTAAINGYQNPGGTTVTSRSFKYGQNQGNLNLSKLIYGTVTTPGPFSSYLSGLTQGQTYFYKACATNSLGTVCGQVLSFTTIQAQTYQCSDNLDNDNDGLIDYPQDPGCTGPTDTSEYNIVLTYACSDGVDNDFDNLIDYPQDPGCTSPTDTSEYNQNQVYQCSDGYDNDFDSLIDMQDPGCTGPTDNDEYNQIVSTLNVTTNSASGVTSTKATLNGYYTAGNILVNQNFFKYGTSYGNLNQTTPTQYPNNYSGNMSIYLSGLLPNMTYYFQACASTTQTGQVCGQVLNFYTPNTPDPGPDNYMNIQTSIATSIGYSAAMLNGIITSNYCNIPTFVPSQTQVWFEYGETTSLGYTTTQSTSNSAFAISIHELKPDTVYYFRAVGQNLCGTYKGAIRSFSTTKKGGNGGGGGVIIINNDIISGDSCMYMKIKSDFESLHVGDTNTYTIDYKNNCKKVVRDAMIVVEIPFELRFERSTKGIFADSSHQLNIPIGTLLPKDSGTIMYQATPMPDALKRDTLITTAHMVYTMDGMSSQGDVLSYVVEHVLGATGQGSTNYDTVTTTKSGFLPATLIGWLLLIFAVLLLVAVVKKSKE